MKKQLISLLLLCCAATLGAKVKLHSLVGDNMIVQQQTDVRLWGTARPGAEIKVTPSWSGQTATCQADAQGRWLLTVKTPQASMTPYEITFDDGEPLTVKNVLVGEVWLASGQSNMEMPLKGFPGCCIKDGAQEIINASSMPQVRMFNVPRKQEYEPQTECGGNWMVPSIETAPEFSATAWFFRSTRSTSAGANSANRICDWSAPTTGRSPIWTIVRWPIRRFPLKSPGNMPKTSSKNIG